ncbi:MAG: DUF2065 family protein [Brucellaceae bacterium]|nr:DUF2065 family protein [Brucellaceae bacterium]
MADLIVAIGLVLVVEGLLYGGFPRMVKRMAAEVIAMPEGALRTGGVIAVALGVLVVWLVRG